ncbi:hypothetical protein MTO96_006638 [Rhipicephalus appendiculatus]
MAAECISRCQKGTHGGDSSAHTRRRMRSSGSHQSAQHECLRKEEGPGPRNTFVRLRVTKAGVPERSACKQAAKEAGRSAERGRLDSAGGPSLIAARHRGASLDKRSGGCRPINNRASYG